MPFSTDPDDAWQEKFIVDMFQLHHVDAERLAYWSFDGCIGNGQTDTVLLDGSYTWQELQAIAACMVNITATLYRANHPNA